jgi:hypothetical protein
MDSIRSKSVRVIYKVVLVRGTVAGACMLCLHTSASYMHENDIIRRQPGPRLTKTTDYHVVPSHRLFNGQDSSVLLAFNEMACPQIP